MAIEIVTIGLPELMQIINSERENAFSSGYIKARKEIESAKAEPVFNELLKGVKELKNYLEYKNYWKGSINTLNKVATQLLEEGDRTGHTLLFRCGCIDRAFRNGFHFAPWQKKGNV